MPFVAAVVSPHPPLLVPDMAGRAGRELDNLRSALGTALDLLYSTAPDLLVLVGGGADTGPAPADAVADFSGFGLPLTVPLVPTPLTRTDPATAPAGSATAPAASATAPADPATAPADPATAGAASAADSATPAGPPRLPLSLAIGAWLLRDRPHEPPRLAQSVATGLDPAACAALGANLAARARRVAFLILGDGSARRGEKSPGYADDRAPAFDAEVTGGLRAGDPAALAAVDPELAADLLAAGRAPWQVLAGAATGVPLYAEVLYDDAPYGVQYTVATWRAR